MRWLAISLLFVGCPQTSSPAPPPTADHEANPVTIAPPPPPSASAPVAVEPAPPSSGPLSVTALRKLEPAPETTHTLMGYVVMRYTCPPCPPGALCKPCMGNNFVLSDDPEPHETYDIDQSDVIVFADDPMQFEVGQKVTIQVKVLRRQMSNRGIHDLELVVEECPHSSPVAGAECHRPRDRVCTYPSGRQDCRRNIATCADGRWTIDCID